MNYHINTNSPPPPALMPPPSCGIKIFSSEGLDAIDRRQYIPATLLLLFFFSASLHFLLLSSLAGGKQFGTLGHSPQSDQIKCLARGGPRLISAGGGVVKQTLRLGVMPEISSAERTRAQTGTEVTTSADGFGFFLFLRRSRGERTCMQMTAVVRMRLHDSGCSFSSSHCKQRREHAAMNNASSRSFKVFEAAEPNVNYFGR